MKKVLCGAMLLLAAVTAFTGCKKDDKGEDGPLTIILSQTAMTKSPGDQEVKITAKLSNGQVETLEWETSNADVVTCSAKGSTATLNFVGYGEATIKCTLKSDKKVFSECVVNVINKLETIKFSRATMSLPRQDSSEVVYWGTYKVNGDTIWARWAEVDLNFVSDAVTIDANDGSWQVTDPNGGYMASLPTYIQVLPYDLNEKIFKDLKVTDDYMIATTCAGKAVGEGVLWETRTDDKIYERTLTASSINEKSYLKLMKDAFVAYNDYLDSGNEQQLLQFMDMRDSAFAQIEGGKLLQFMYDDEYGVWYPSPAPCGLITTAQAKLLYAIDDNPYLYSIELGKLVIKPFQTAADLSWGLNLEMDEFTGKFIFDEKQTKVNYEKEVTTIYRLND